MSQLLCEKILQFWTFFETEKFLALMKLYSISKQRPSAKINDFT